MLVNWRDDREYDGWWKNYVNHVDAEGNIAYPNEMDAVRVAYLEDGISIAGASIAHNDQEGTSFVAYRFYAQKSQDYEGLGVQKIADNGELLWDAEGINVEDLSLISKSPTCKCSVPKTAAASYSTNSAKATT